MKIYLAGPIGGKTEGEAKDWRKWVNMKITKVNNGIEDNLGLCRGVLDGLVCISPLRCEPPISPGKHYDIDGYADPKFGLAKAIHAKNYFDVNHCDMVLAYMPEDTTEGVRGDTQHSKGTLVEIGWAFALGKPVILVTDDEELARHAVIKSCASWILPTLYDAVDLIAGICGGYVGGKNV